MNRVALVTGANRGIGKETARRLALLGFTVLLGSRDSARGESAARELSAAGAHVSPVRLDVTDTAMLEALAARLGRDHGHLDVLVNNAGVFEGATALDTTAEEMRSMFEVNVFGVVATIHAMLPLLRAAPAPRIVNVSSATASLALTADGTALPGDPTRRMAYASSKAALNMLTIHYARAFAADLDLSHIKVNSATPGYTATAMNEFSAPRTVVEGARAVVTLATLPDDGPTGCFFGDEGQVPW